MECEISAPQCHRQVRQINRQLISDQVKAKAEALGKVLLLMANKSPFIRRDLEFWDGVVAEISTFEDGFHPGISGLKLHNSKGLLQFFDAKTMKFLPPDTVNELEKLK